MTVDDRFAGDAEVVKQLGAARRLEAEEERAAIESFRRGDLWCTRDETIKLSRIEAATLASRYAEALPGEAGRRLAAALEAEMNAAFEAVHAGKATLADVRAGWKKTIERGVDKAGLTAEERRLVERR